MNHSDCDGEYTPEEAKLLLEELKKIEHGLKKVKYPVARYLGADGVELCCRAKYSSYGTFVYGNGFDFGVAEGGLVVESRDPRRLPVVPDEKYIDIIGEEKYRWYFTAMECAGENTWVAKRRDGHSVVIEGLYTTAPEGCARIEAGEISAYEVFKYTIDVLKKACEESIATGEPIVYWSTTTS